MTASTGGIAELMRKFNLATKNGALQRYGHGLYIVTCLFGIIPNHGRENVGGVE